MSDNPVFGRIKEDIDTNDVVLFMKGLAGLSAMRFLGGIGAGLDPARREIQGRRRASRSQHPRGNQGILELADHSAALCQGRVRWRPATSYAKCLRPESSAN